MPKIVTQEEFIEQCRKTHGDKYDYSRVVYIKAREKVEIVCREHGAFWQEAHAHKTSQGCPSCVRTTTQEQVIETLRRLYPDQYDLSEVVWGNSKTKLKITCKDHGVFYEDSNKLLSGFCCPGCRKETNRQKNLQQFRAKYASEKWEYDWDTYTNSFTPMKMVCPTHGEFWQPPRHQRVGSGCQSCAKRGFSFDGESHLYILSNSEEFKVGVAKNIAKRTQVINRKRVSHGLDPLDLTTFSLLPAKVALHSEIALLKKLRKTYTPVEYTVDGSSETFKKTEDFNLDELVKEAEEIISENRLKYGR